MNRFTLWDAPHLISLLVIFFLFIGLIELEKIFPQQRRKIGWAIALFLIGNELLEVGYAVHEGIWSYEWALPLHLCDLALIAVAVSLFYPVQWIFELAYFWGLGGSLIAMLTPDLLIGFPHLPFLFFFTRHALTFIGAGYLAFTLKLPIDRTSVIRVWIATHMYAALIAIFNLLFDTNYLFLCQKPQQPSPLDYLGPWPIYLLGMEAAFLLSLLVLYRIKLLIDEK